MDGTAHYRSVYAHTYADCKAKLTEATARRHSEPPSSAKQLRFREAIYQWLSVKQMQLKSSTKLKYRDMIEKHILPELGELPLSTLNAVVISSFLERKLHCGGVKSSTPLASSYVRTMAILITSALEFAASLGWCVPLKIPPCLPSVPKKEPTVLTKIEEETLTDFLLQEHSLTVLGTLLALQAGLRIGEVCALRWCDIDLEKRLLHVRHTLSRTVSEETSKTVFILDRPKSRSSHRDVPLTAALLQKLHAAREIRLSDYVISETSSFVGTRTFEYRYKALLKRAGVRPINFHALRHTYATRCAEAGMDAKMLSMLLGHASATTTLNVYVHPSMESASQQVEAIYRLA
ncbi:MAG: site-specific integrase [Clostridia bacterium]|nr:site-specific integrase [Clostridia bacterium]